MSAWGTGDFYCAPIINRPKATKRRADGFYALLAFGFLVVTLEQLVTGVDNVLPTGPRGIFAFIRSSCSNLVVAQGCFPFSFRAALL